MLELDDENDIELIADLDVAIEKREFSLNYQPIFNNLQQVEWCEVLLRWIRKRDGKHISPKKFIPLAENKNKVNELWTWSWETALKQLRDWRNKSDISPQLAFNFSPSQVDFSKNSRYSYSDQIKNWCDVYELSTSSFWVELTETSLLKDYDWATKLFEELKTIGVKLCIDDFGTGFSSLSMLKSLPVNTVKIDGSFIAGLPDSAPNRAIVKATIALALELGIKVVAECVESEREFEYLKSLGCNYFQGYYLAKPMPSEDLEKLVITPVA